MILRSAPARVALLAVTIWTLAASVASAQGVDSCSQVVPDVLQIGTPLTWIGDNSNATGGGDAAPGTALDGYDNIWYAFTTDTCTDIIIDYCGSPTVFEYWNVLVVTCPATNQLVVTQITNNATCGDGNATMRFNNVAAGTYYYPVYMDPGTAFGPFVINVNAVACGGSLPPPNDDCSQVIPELLVAGDTLTFTGDNTNATQANDFLPGVSPAGPVVWHAITTVACANITVAYCGQSPAWGNAFGFLSVNCPGDSVRVGQSTFNTTACGDGNLTYIYNNVAAGTYYVPVLLDPGNDAVGPYAITVSATVCSGPTYEDFCSQTLPVILVVGDTLVLTGDNSNATPTGDFLPGASLEGAPVVWHQISLPTCTDVTLSYCGQNPVWDNTLGRLAVDCPDDTLVNATGFNLTDCGDGNATYFFSQLPAGNYYLPVLLDPANNAVGPYSIELVAEACSGIAPLNDNCADVTPANLVAGDTLTFSGDNTNATLQGDWADSTSTFGSTPVVWHIFTTDTCTEVTISYCGLNPAWTNSLGVLATSCPADSLVYLSSLNDTVCGDQNITYYFYQLEAGAYYVPVLLDTFHNAVGPYSIEVSAVNCLGTGLAANGRPSFSVFPNPSNGDMTVRNDGAFVVQWIEVLDLSGRSIHHERVNLAPGQRLDLHLQGRAEQGMYTLRAMGAEGRAEQHIVVR